VNELVVREQQILTLERGLEILERLPG